MQGNRQSKFLTRLFRGFFGLLIALASIIAANFLLAIILERIVQRNKELRAKLLKPYNAVILKIAGVPFSPYASLKHVGRRSGREYETPLGAYPLGDGFVLALAYGPDVDWCCNVMAAGKCTLKWKGHEYALEKPEIIPISEAWEAYPLPIRLVMASERIKQGVWVHRTPRCTPVHVRARRQRTHPHLAAAYSSNKQGPLLQERLSTILMSLLTGGNRLVL